MTQAAPPTLRPSFQGTARDAGNGRREHPRRVYALNLMRSRHEAPPGLLSWICDLGCDTLLLALPARLGSGDIEMPPLVDAAVAAGLQVQIDLVLHVATDRAAVLQEHPEWFREPARRFADPRLLKTPPGLHILDPAAAGDEAFIGYWTGVLGRWRDHGISGCRCKALGRIPPAVWRLLVEASPELHFSAWAPGEAAEDIGRLPRGCFGAVYNSLAWWDFDAEWLSQELARLRPVAPIANTVGLQDGSAPGRVMLRAAARLLDVAAANGHGFLLPMGFEFGIPSDLTHPEFGTDDWQRLQEHGRVEVAAALRQAGRRLAARVVPDAAPEILSGPGSAVAVLFEPPAQLTVANRSLERPARFDPSSVLPMLDGRQAGFADAAGTRLGRSPVLLAPGETRVFSGSPSRPVVTAAASRRSKRKQDFGAAGLAAATAASRVVIEAVTPTVDNGRFAAKRAVGERVVVEADVFVDGHGKVAAVLQWRAGDETGWRETPMQPLGNDRWSASFLPERVGCHWFRIQAWPDRFATYRDELGKKHAAGLDVTLELEEGRLLIEAMAESAPGTLDTLLAGLQGNGEERYPLLMGEEAAALTARADQRPGQVTSGEMPVEADRRAAQFASWYELFPRSQSGEASRHGTFRDVMRRLPAIRDMGFDVLYFPPIHPIGRINRKGRNNTLTPTQDDPGSPYAIGAAEGGHDAIHPELGTLDDFRALRDAAAAHGLELALDFAIQCSPDHPWLREHPEWFDWRPDGGLRYAENPPKKYEDIVNVDFHQAGAIPSLWLALRDVVAFWVREGVRIFRVDNPHTKPFPFWEWLIADIRASHPDTLFLSEAFTRPKVMQRLAKLGFTQSYTYFTWRNEKHEIETYLRELTAAAPAGANQADFFRPNFFVNTPDINPTFLQRSGRPGFLIRAALATTLSGLWGMLQGFEFCEAEPIPGKEEYANSDKYEIRSRPDRMPGDIVGEITRLNAIRRANPALQSHLGLAFHNAASDRVLWYRKANVDRSNVVLVAVSLDPFEPQTAVVEVPLWEWGLGDHAAIMVDDLMNGSTTTWHGKHRTISLDPRRLPFGIWRARPQETA